jgi:hypothetical protein
VVCTGHLQKYKNTVCGGKGTATKGEGDIYESTVCGVYGTATKVQCGVFTGQPQMYSVWNIWDNHENWKKIIKWRCVDRLSVESKPFLSYLLKFSK